MKEKVERGRFTDMKIVTARYERCDFERCDFSDVGQDARFIECMFKDCENLGICGNAAVMFDRCSVFGSRLPVELDATLPPGTYTVSVGGLRDGAILTARNGQRYRMGSTLRLDRAWYTFDPEEGGALYLAAGTTITGPDKEIVDAPRLFKKRMRSGTWRDGLS